MKVLDLFCAQGHGFEGWFASEEDFQNQLACGLVQCPLCTSADVRKALSAPRLNLRATAPRSIPEADEAPPQPSSPAAAPAAEPALQELQAAWLRVARRIVAQTEDVGTRFAEEARRMHYGDAQERGIRGQATAREAEELLDEGIAVMPLPLPAATKEPLQ